MHTNNVDNKISYGFPSLRADPHSARSRWYLSVPVADICRGLILIRDAKQN